MDVLNGEKCRETPAEFKIEEGSKSPMSGLACWTERPLGANRKALWGVPVDEKDSNWIF